MFACLYLPPPVKPVQGSRLKAQGPAQDVVQLARDFSPRVERHGDRLVTLDINGLGSLLGDARAIGEELRRTAADRGLRVHVAIAATTTAAILLAQSRAGLVVIPASEEAEALAPLPISVLESLAAVFAPLRGASADRSSLPAPLAPFARWGLRTLGDLAALPSAELSERLGQQGLVWQRWARGQDARPLVPAGVEDAFEEALDLDWPIEGLEPLSFVLARLFDPLCDRLEQQDRGAVVLHVTLTLVTRELHERSLQLPAPMRDARVLRTLALLDLESHPPPAAIDRVRVGVEVTEGRVLQFGLFARALPTERLATLMARLSALMGSERVGAPALVDSHRPGAFAMGTFEPLADSKSREQRAKSTGHGLADRESLRSSGRSSASGAKSWGWGPTSDQRGSPRALNNVVRRFRSPIPARVTLEQGRPVRVTTDRRGFTGGVVERCDGPWRSSGDWWLFPAFAPRGASARKPAFALHAPHAPVAPVAPRHPWNCDEWDVTLSDGASYRISQAPSQWFVDGILD